MAYYQKYKGFEIREATGKGPKITSTIRVVEPWDKQGYLIKKRFRFTVASSESKIKAIKKARAYIDDLVSAK